MSEGQTFKPRSRFMAAALSAALALGMTPSFTILAADQAYANEAGTLAPAQIAAQDEGESAVNWAKVYGGDSGSGTDTFSSALVNSFQSALTLKDGTIVASGQNALKASGKNSLDAVLAFYGNDGTEKKTVTFSSSMYDGFEKVIQASDGSLIAVGYAGNGDGDFEGIVASKDNAKPADFDAVICKLDAEGNLIKAAAFGGTGKDMFRDVVELDDGSFIAVGYQSSQDGDMQDKGKTETRDALVVKYSADLSESSIVDIVGGTSVGMEEARAVIKGIDGGFVVAGTGFSNDGDFEGKYKSETNNRGDFFLATYNDDGTRAGLAMYGGSDNEYFMGLDYDYYTAEGVAQASPTGYVLVGYGKSTDGDLATLGGSGNEVAALMRVAKDGQLVEAVPVASATKTYANSVISSDKGYFVAGSFTGELKAGSETLTAKGGEDVFSTFIAKGESGYVSNPVKTFGGTAVDRVRAAALGSDSNVVLVGTTQSDEFEGATIDDKSRAFAMSVKADSVMPEGTYASIKAAAERAASLQELDAQLAAAETATFGHATIEQWAALQTAVADAKALDREKAEAAQVSAAAQAVSAALQAVNAANQVAVALPAENGDYTLVTTAYSESKFRTPEPSVFQLGRQFDPSIKLVKSDAGLQMQLLYTSTIDMQKVELDGIEATKVGFGAKNADGETYGMYLFSIALPGDFNLNADHKLSFSYDTGRPNLGNNGVMTHSVYLAGMSTAAWNGYSSLAAQLGSAEIGYRAGTYAVAAKILQASSDKASMAAAAFNSNAQLTVADDGSAVVEIGMKPLSFMGVTAYADNVKVYQAAAASGDAVDAEEVTTQVVTVNDAQVTVPTTLKFTIPAAAMASDSIFLSLEAPGSPMASAQTVRLQLGYAQLADSDAAAQERVASLVSWITKDAGLADKDAVDAAVAAYEALTDEQKANVPASVVEVLDAAKASVEAAVAQKEAADKAAHTIAAVKLAQDKATYTGSEIQPKVTVTAQDGTEVSAGNYKVEYANNVNAGTAKVTVTGTNGYTGTVEATFTVAPASINSATVALKKAKGVYTGKAQKGAVKSVTLNGKALAGGDYKVSAKSGKNVGSYAVTVTGTGNYTGTATAAYQVTKAAAKAKVVKTKSFKASALKKVKSFKAVTLTTDGKATWKVVKKDAKKALTFTKGKVTVKKGTKAGTYTMKVKVTAKAGKNYKAFAAKTYTIKVKVN